MKKTIALVALILAVLMASTSAMAYNWDLEGTIFPLEDKVTFNVLTSGYRGAFDVRNIEQNQDWQDLLAQTNVEINFVYLGSYDGAESRDNLQARILNGDYCDVIWGFYVDTLTTDDINDLAGAGKLIALTDYIQDSEVMPNMYSNITKTHPAFINNMKSSDGEIYYYAGVSELNAYTAGEAQMMVNSEWMKAWQADAGVDHAPETLDEFEDMLYFFRDSDLNGNGEADEVPYFIAQATYAGCMTLEHAMGMYGIATKDSTADMDIQIDDDGNCYYVYTTDTYKEALKTFAKWYADNLVWSEAFTANSETITGVVADAANKIGLCNVCENLTGFETILPPTIEGYQARYHMHPSVRLGVRQPMMVVTDKCANPEIFASFVDLLYNFDNYIIWNNGSRALDIGSIVIDDEGKYSFVKLENVPEATEANVAVAGYLSRMEVDTIDNFNTSIDMDSYFGEQARVKGFRLYDEANIWNPTENLWPRCTILPEYAEDYAFMYTDVSATLAEYRAKFVTGEYDIDEKWDEFQDKLQTLGIEKMQEIIQESYNAFANK